MGPQRIKVTALAVARRRHGLVKRHTIAFKSRSDAIKMSHCRHGRTGGNGVKSRLEAPARLSHPLTDLINALRVEGQIVHLAPHAPERVAHCGRILKLCRGLMNSLRGVAHLVDFINGECAETGHDERHGGNDKQKLSHNGYVR
ncbi:MAG: hypothetical protein LAT81_07075 [Oceanicaulis sp.]|nr:hypothetical protein [Oceanicaulis sp.]